MAHKQLENGNVIVDWTTGDPEGDRINLLSAYRDFVKEIEGLSNLAESKDYQLELQEVLKKWSIDTENQVDEVPRIWISRPL